MVPRTNDVSDPDNLILDLQDFSPQASEREYNNVDDDSGFSWPFSSKSSVVSEESTEEEQVLDLSLKKENVLENEPIDLRVGFPEKYYFVYIPKCNEEN